MSAALDFFIRVFSFRESFSTQALRTLSVFTVLVGFLTVVVLQFTGIVDFSTLLFHAMAAPASGSAQVNN